MQSLTWATGLNSRPGSGSIEHFTGIHSERSANEHRVLIRNDDRKFGLIKEDNVHHAVVTPSTLIIDAEQAISDTLTERLMHQIFTARGRTRIIELQNRHGTR